MASTIETVAQTLAIGGIGKCSLTAIEQDPETGLFVRELRVYALLDNGSVGDQVVAVRLTGISRDAISMQTPQFNY